MNKIRNMPLSSSDLCYRDAVDLAKTANEKIHLLFETDRNASEEILPILAHTGDLECPCKPLPCCPHGGLRIGGLTRTSSLLWVIIKGFVGPLLLHVDTSMSRTTCSMREENSVISHFSKFLQE